METEKEFWIETVKDTVGLICILGMAFGVMFWGLILG